MSYVSGYLTASTGVVLKQAALAASAQVEIPLPRTWALIGGIYVTVQGEAATDGATHAEMMSMIDQFRLSTSKGEEVNLDGFDLGKWSGWVRPGHGRIAAVRGGYANNQENAITYYYPLGLGWKSYVARDTPGKLFGLPGFMADRVTISFDDDAEVDGKQLTVEAEGLLGDFQPYAYQVVSTYDYTAADGNIQQINLPTNAILRGVFIYQTENWDTDSTNTEIDVDEIIIVKNQTPVLRSSGLTRQFGIQRLEVNDSGANDAGCGGYLNLESACHVFWDLDHSESGHGYFIDSDTKLHILGGQAHAIHVMRVLYSLVPERATGTP